jgi:uncharacterized protein
VNLRVLLLTGVACSLAGAAAACASAAPQAPAARIAGDSPQVDHHVHIFSPAALGTILRIQEVMEQPAVASENSTATVEDLLLAMDGAGVERAAVLSAAYMFGIPELDLADAGHLARAENDHVAAQIARYPARLVGFCSVNPLATWALAEIARCATLAGMVGLKLHLANSDVDLRNEEHVQRLGEVFGRANDLGLALAVHVRTRNPQFGRTDAEIVETALLSRTPDVPVQLAHMTGGGGYDGGTDAALAFFSERLRDPGSGLGNRLFFDLSFSAIPLTLLPEAVRADPAVLAQIDAAHGALAARIRAIGVERMLYGSDWAGEDGMLTMAAHLELMRSAVPLEPEEWATIFGNVAPYMARGR